MVEHNSTIIVKGGAFISGSATMSSMVIFNDPVYLVLAIMGASISFLGMAHELVKAKRLGKKERDRLSFVLVDLIKALIIGGLLTPMFFMLLVNSGGEIASHVVGFKTLNGVFNSFWWLLSLILSWYSPLIWAWTIKYFKGRLSGK